MWTRMSAQPMWLLSTAPTATPFRPSIALFKKSSRWFCEQPAHLGRVCALSMEAVPACAHVAQVDRVRVKAGFSSGSCRSRVRHEPLAYSHGLVEESTRSRGGCRELACGAGCAGCWRRSRDRRRRRHATSRSRSRRRTALPAPRTARNGMLILQSMADVSRV